MTVGLRLSGQAAGVALGPDTGQPRHAAARHQKAAGFQLRAALLGNGPRLARDEGLVRLGAAVQHDGVRCDLVARAELDNIVLDKVVGQHLAPPAVAQAAELLRRDKRQLVDGTFGAQLLHNADEGIPEHDAQKSHIQPGMHERQHDGQHQKHKVEVGADVIPHDLAGGFGLGLGRLVRLPRRAARFDLGGGQAGDGWHSKGCSFRVGSNGGRGRTCPARACMANGRQWEGRGPGMPGPYRAAELF